MNGKTKDLTTGSINKKLILFALPLLAEHASWYRVMDTSEPESFLLQPEALGKIRSFRVPPRTIMILEGREDETE